MAGETTIETRPSEMTLIQKLAKIRVMADAVAKSKRGARGSYADITEILAKVTSGMNKYGVSLIPQITPGSVEVERITTTNTKVDKSGTPYENTVTEMLVKATMTFRWVNDDNENDYIEVPWFVTGAQTDPSQAFGSGLTYCTRYFLTNYFQIAQPDTDVDAYRAKQKEAETAESKAIAAAIIETFDTEAKVFFADHPDRKEGFEAFVTRYSKSPNYFKITDPEIAAKLLNDFREKFMKGE